MKRGLGIGLTMLGIAAFTAACEHEAQRATTPANRVNAGFFESSAPRPASAEPASSRAPMPGHTDKFLWDDRQPKADDEATDGGTKDAGPRANPDGI
jgi:hypothetical protein